MTEVKKEPEETSEDLNMQQMPARPTNTVDMKTHSFRPRGNRSTFMQKRFLVDFMENHRDFACGRHVGPRQRTQALWNELVIEVNTLGPKKSVAQWQKAWTDLKSRAKARVQIKKDHPQFDPISDLDARVLSMMESFFLPSTNRADCNSTVNMRPVSNPALVETESMDLSTLEPEMVLLPETEAFDSSSLADDKSAIQRDLENNTQLDVQNNSYDPIETGQNYDDDSLYDALETGETYDGNNSFETRDTRQNWAQRPGSNSVRNRWRKVPYRTIPRSNLIPPVSNIQRRQTETLEAISKAMLQNAENDKERNRLMTRSLELDSARLKAELERNDLLRDLVSTLKGISQNKNQRLC